MIYPTDEQIQEWCRNAPAAGPERDVLIARRSVDLTRAALSADRPGTRLAVHPDGTPMVSIGEAADLDTIARLAADPEHARAALAQPAPPAEGEVGELVAEPSDAELLEPQAPSKEVE